MARIVSVVIVAGVLGGGVFGACTSEAGPIDPSLRAFDVRRVEVTPPLDTIFAADTIRPSDVLQLSAVVRGVGDRPLVGAQPIWYSEDTLTAVVSETGLVRPVQYGTVRIVASAAKRGYATVVVMPAVSAISVVPAAATVLVSEPLSAGDTVRLRATARDATGASVAGSRIVWSSSSAAIATIDSTGLVRARSLGTTQITARSNGVSATTSVVVAPR